MDRHVKRLTISCLAACLTACASAPSYRVEIRSAVPESAEVTLSSGEVLGNTPLVLEGTSLLKATQGGMVTVLIRAPRHYPREVMLPLIGSDVHSVALTPLNADFFSATLMEDYSESANDLTRSLIEIQNLILSRKIPDATRLLQEFQRRYPTIAAGYLLASSIESLQGNTKRAVALLKRARELDPKDALVARLLLKQGIRDGRKE